MPACFGGQISARSHLFVRANPARTTVRLYTQILGHPMAKPPGQMGLNMLGFFPPPPGVLRQTTTHTSALAPPEALTDSKSKLTQHMGGFCSALEEHDGAKEVAQRLGRQSPFCWRE